jgi:PKHD-type hydroxylase
LEFNDENAWLFNSTIEKIIQTNFRYFNLELTAMESLQHTTYNAPTDTYGPHVDITNISPLHRKLSFTVQLSDPSEYEGGDLMLYDYGLDVKPAPKTKGSVVIFYSHILHEVTPVTSGTRKALVGWFSGPPLK